MTVVLDLNAEQEDRLRMAAEARGIDTDTLAHEIVLKALEELPARPPATNKGMLGLGALGVEWISEDFDAPLPNSFWLGPE